MKIEFLLNGEEPEPFLVVSDGYIHEEINKVTRIEILAASSELLTEEQLGTYIGKNVTIKLTELKRCQIEVNRYDGVVFEVHQPNPYAVAKGQYIYQFVIRPGIWKMNIGCNAKSFLHKSRIEVIEEVLEVAGFVKDVHYQTRFVNEKDYPTLSQILQCEVSDWVFIQQLLQEAGINYSFHSNPEEEKSELIRFSDDNVFFPKVISHEIAWHPSGNVTSTRHIDSFETKIKAVPTSIQATSVFGDGRTDVYQSTVDMDKGTGSAFRVFGVEGHEETAATQTAKKISHEFDANRIGYEGSSNYFLLRAGEKITVRNSELSIEKKLLVTAVRHHFRQNVGSTIAGPKDVVYSNQFTGVKEAANIRPLRYTTTIQSQGSRFHPASERSSNPDRTVDTQNCNSHISPEQRGFDNEVAPAIEQLSQSANRFGMMIGMVIGDTSCTPGQEMVCKISNERFFDGIIAKVSTAWLVPGGGASALPRAGMQVYFQIVQGVGGQNEAVVTGYRPSRDVAGQDPAKSRVMSKVTPGEHFNELVKEETFSPSNRHRVGFTGENNSSEITLLDDVGTVSLYATDDLLMNSKATTRMCSSAHVHLSGPVCEQFESVARTVRGYQMEKIFGEHHMVVQENQHITVGKNFILSTAGQNATDLVAAEDESVDVEKGNQIKISSGSDEMLRLNEGTGAFMMSKSEATIQVGEQAIRVLPNEVKIAFSGRKEVNEEVMKSLSGGQLVQSVVNGDALGGGLMNQMTQDALAQGETPKGELVQDEIIVGLEGITIKSNANVTVNGVDVSVTATNINASGQTVAVSGTDMTVSGENVNVSGGDVTLSGSLVKIN